MFLKENLQKTKIGCVSTKRNVYFINTCSVRYIPQKDKMSIFVNIILCAQFYKVRSLLKDIYFVLLKKVH